MTQLREFRVNEKIAIVIGGGGEGGGTGARS